MHLKALADSSIFIILCYCFSFGPWGILFALDFISPNWRTIRHTRISGLIHIFFSIISLAVALFYLIVQRAAGDYKEMMASCVAAIVALYHISRTISGLAQLRAYIIWCRKAVYCLDKLNSVDKVHRNTLRWHNYWLYQRMARFAQTHESHPSSHANSPDSYPTSPNAAGVGTAPEYHASQGARDSTSIPMGHAGINEEEIAKLVDTQMLVNNQAIDNELFGSELPVRLCFPRCGILRGLLNVLSLRFDDWLCSGDIVRCSLRWTIAVLSNFGRHWVHSNKPKSFPATNAALHLPYQMPASENFHHVIRASQNTLTTDALFYNGGAFDDVDISQRNIESEIELSKKRMESLRNLNTKQVLYFLALMAQNGDTTHIPMEAVQESTSHTPRSRLNWFHRAPPHPSSIANAFGQGLT